jgi:sialate O-acetylesterase
LDFRLWIGSLVLISVLKVFNVGNSPPDKELVISGQWLFKTGYSSSWSRPELKDSDWASIHVPSAWEHQGFSDYDGTAWYRKHVFIPEDWKNSAGLTFDIGKIDDEDKVYFNGYLVGSSTGWQKWRKYSIPSRVVKYGEDNVLTVMVNDTGGNGGIWDGPLRLTTGITADFDVEGY